MPSRRAMRYAGTTARDMTTTCRVCVSRNASSASPGSQATDWTTGASTLGSEDGASRHAEVARAREGACQLAVEVLVGEVARRRAARARGAGGLRRSGRPCAASTSAGRSAVAAARARTPPIASSTTSSLSAARRPLLENGEGRGLPRPSHASKRGGDQLGATACRSPQARHRRDPCRSRCTCPWWRTACRCRPSSVTVSVGEMPWSIDFRAARFMPV